MKKLFQPSLCAGSFAFTVMAFAFCLLLFPPVSHACGGGGFPPTADFSASPTCVGTNGTVNFTDLSTGTPASWSWTFQGGTPGTSTLQNPSVVYNTAGVFDVTLAATNTDGTGTLAKTGYITVGVPIVNLGHDITLSCFTNTTLNAGNPGATYLWSTGATTQTIATPVSAVSKNYSVTVTNCNGSVSDNVTIHYPSCFLAPPRIIAGGEHSMAICNDGTLRAWGYNYSGQIGDNTTTDRNTPVQVLGGASGSTYLTGTTAAAGLYHSLAVKNDGTVWAWGNNWYGNLGDNTTTDRWTPVQVSGISGIISVAAGYYHSLALKSDGTVWAWGRNNLGQLGDGTIIQRNTPVQVSGLTGIIAVRASGVGAGDSHSMALRADGTVWTWGGNGSGQLGDGTSTNRLTPVQVKGEGGTGYLTGIQNIEAGGIHSLALKSDGTVLAWGGNGSGQLGNNTLNNSYAPVQVPGLTGITAIGAGAVGIGGGHSLAIKNDGTVWAWGYNYSGQLGDNTTVNRLTPVQVKDTPGTGFLTNITAVEGGGGGIHSMALKNDGSVWVWGESSNGRLGVSTNGDAKTPVELFGLCSVGTVPGSSCSAAIDLGRGDTCTSNLAISDSVMWFKFVTNTSYVELEILNNTTPVTINLYSGDCNNLSLIQTKSGINGLFLSEMNLTDSNSYFLKISSSTIPINLQLCYSSSLGQNYSHLICSDKSVKATGWNAYGQLGDGTTTDQNTFISIPGLTNIKDVEGGVFHSFALDNNGNLWTWGRNNYGQLGDGTTTDKLNPVQITSLTSIVAVAAGRFHSIALKSDGTVWTWGRNNDGQLGNGTTTNFNPTPTINGLTGVIAVAAGYEYCLALKSDGTVWAWGVNGSGQLGDNTLTTRSSPIQVNTINGIVDIGCGTIYSMALKNDGTVWCWGNNMRGQSGNGSLSPIIPSPVQANISSIVAIAAGGLHCMALKSNGQVWAWGDNTWGALGQGSSSACTGFSATPKQVIIITGVTEIMSEGGHNFAFDVFGTVWGWGADGNGELGNGINIMSICFPNQIAVGCTIQPCPNTNIFSLTSQNVIICPGQSTNIFVSASGGKLPYTYAWVPSSSLNNPTTANPIATPNSTTTYNVTVTDGNGCSSTGAVTITVNPLPTVDFTIDPNSQLCIGQGVNFLDNTTGANPPFTYLWTFSSATPSTSSATNPSGIVYNNPGTYPVSLTVTDANGCTSIATQNIQIAPNCCAFASAIVYDDASPFFQSPITSSTPPLIFQSAPYRINTTIFIQAPAVWTIPIGQAIEFGPFGKIIVENGTGNSSDPNRDGAQLIMGKNSKFTSITNTYNNCPVMWQGVEVWGVPANYSSNALGQGKITMNAGATIENAHIGVLLGKGVISKKRPFDLGRSGGIIDAIGAVFNNNAASIMFLPYKYSNASKIQVCIFSAPALLDPGYNSNISGYHYPNPNNPYYAPNNPLGMGVWHTRLWGVKGVLFRDNTFNAVFGESILAIDSRFYAQKLSTRNIFNINYSPSGLIHIINTVSSPAYSHRIQDNIFNVAFPKNFPGINIEGSQGSDLITGNLFNPSEQPIPSGANAQADGIRLNNSSGFQINGTTLPNTFNILFRGIKVNNSGAGGGNIGFPGGNNFTQCHISVYAFNSNPKLQIKCNNFDNALSQYYNPASLQDANIFSAGALADQGVNTSPSDPDPNRDKKPAGNEFLQVSDPPNPLIDKNQISATVSYVYYRHNRGLISQFSILPDQTGSPALITITNTGVDKTPTSCDDPCTCQNCCRLAQLSTQSIQLQTLKQEYNTALASIDKGRTAQLIAAINAPTPPEQLRDTLLAASPLSDEVLLAFIRRAIPTPSDIFNEAMLPNLPASDTVWTALLAVLDLSADMAGQILNAQGNNPPYRTLTAILRDIGAIETDRAQALSGVIGYYVETDSLTQLTTLLEQEGTDYANQLLMAFYLADSNLTAASAKLSVLPNSTPDEQGYVDLNAMLITLASEEKTVFDMDSAQEQLVRQIATMNISSLARTNARAILLLVFHERFEEEIPLPPARMANNQEGATAAKTKNSIYPNPASENIELHYKLSDKESGLLEIFSIVGNKIVSYSLSFKQTQFNIPVKHLENSIYLYRFSVNGELMEEGKLVITNK